MSDVDESLDNDSMDEYPFTMKQMVSYGRKINATHLLVCYDGYADSDPSPVYVFDRSKLENTIDACHGGCPSVSVYDLFEDDEKLGLS